MTESKRTPSIDLLRGVVMIVMALDHTRDFFGATTYEPTDLDKTNAPLFFTRWITHFCAPVFVFLAGTAAWLSRARKSDAELARFLSSRGLWLVFLEVFVVDVCWSFAPPLSMTVLQVIWAIGASMVVLSALVRLPAGGIAAIGGALVVGHNALDRVHVAPGSPLHGLWSVLHERDFRLSLFGVRVGVFYPLVPWVGVMMLGFAFGSVFARLGPRGMVTRPVAERSRDVMRIGLAVTAAFVAVRALNVYGDPQPWAPRASAVQTAMAFLNCEKYPPSLCYLLMTLGPALVALAAFDRAGAGEAGVSRVVVIFGRVPLFYYVLHLVLLHAASNELFTVLEGHARGDIFSPAGRLDVGLPLTYVIWSVAVAALYFPCRWFANVKASDWGRGRAWLSYL